MAKKASARGKRKSIVAQYKAKAKGKEIRKAYVEAIPGLKQLLKGIKLAAERGYVRACVGLRDYETGKYRAIRARLVGWSKKEALANYKKFLKDKKKKR